MSEILFGDVIAAARVLISVPERRWGWLLCRMVAEARRARRHFADQGRQHPHYGDGTLHTAAMRRKPSPEPVLKSERYRRALIFVLKRVYPLAQETQAASVGSRSKRPVAISSPQS